MHFVNPEETFDLVIHRVGNKSTDEGTHLSKTLTFYPQELSETLYSFFTKPFKTDEYFRFADNDGLEANTAYAAVKSIFEEPSQLLHNSVHLANHLYNVSFNPKVRGGDLFVVYFPDAIVEGEHTKAVGIFKSETKERILKALPTENSYDVNIQEGILLSKIDKACLIFNVEEEKGFVVANYDNSKGDEIGVWTDDFLGLMKREDEYFDTENTLNLCKSFVLDKLPEDFEVKKVDQVDLLNKSVNFFKENEEFKLGDFAQKVLVQDELKQSFEDYKKHYEDLYEVELNDQFEISKNAVKKQARFFKSIIKLDKNFHIYVHGDRQKIEQGTDDEGKKFYKLYYEAEN